MVHGQEEVNAKDVKGEVWINGHAEEVDVPAAGNRKYYREKRALSRVEPSPAAPAYVCDAIAPIAYRVAPSRPITTSCSFPPELTIIKKKTKKNIRPGFDRLAPLLPLLLPPPLNRTVRVHLTT